MDISVKDQILNAALELFFVRGYKDSSVNSIIEKVGVSKGAFYHYFSSKEEVLATICKRHTDGQLAIMKTIASDPELTAPEKLLRITIKLFGVRKGYESHGKVYAILTQNSNVAEVQNVIIEANERGRLLYLSVIEQGIAEGTFRTDYPQELSALYVQLLNVMKQSLVKTNSVEELEKRLCFYEEAVTRLLGAEAGTLPITHELMNVVQRR